MSHKNKGGILKKNHVAIEVSRDEHYQTPFLKSLKENWPSLAKDYRHYCHTYSPKTGNVWTWTSPEGQKFFHLILDEKNEDIQAHPHSNTNRLNNFKKTLKELKKVSVEDDIQLIELPKLGFHFSDQEFEQANKIMTESFSDTKTQIKFI